MAVENVQWRVWPRVRRLPLQRARISYREVAAVRENGRGIKNAAERDEKKACIKNKYIRHTLRKSRSKEGRRGE